MGVLSPAPLAPPPSAPPSTTLKLWIFFTNWCVRPMVPHVRMAMACLVACLTFNSKAMVLLRTHYQIALSMTSVLTLVLMVWRLWQMLLRPSWACYLLDFCCTEAEGNINANEENFKFFLGTWRDVKESNLLFQFKVLSRSGVGGESYAPPRLIHMGEDSSLSDARVETENLIEKAARRLLAKLSIDPKEIDILILNSSLFNPIPSLTSFVVNSLHMRSNVKSFNLSGMGCSAGLISIGLAKDLLKVHKNSFALVISTENITRNMYYGNDRSFMVSNCLFRCGCAAILLTNKPSYRGSAKLELLKCLRTNLGAEQDAYESVHHMEDSEGKLGVKLQLSLVEVAGKALRANIVKLAPSILPMGEILRVGMNLVQKKVLKMKVRSYEPDFKKAIDHFCIHPGGRAVIASIGKGLKLDSYHIEPGKMALNRFGNTSSSGIWYALAYCEAKGRLKKGQKIWQIALGSGFKCNSGVWKVLKDIDPSDAYGCNPWLSSIHRYPVDDPPMAPPAPAPEPAPASAPSMDTSSSSSSDMASGKSSSSTSALMCAAPSQLPLPLNNPSLAPMVASSPSIQPDATAASTVMPSTAAVMMPKMVTLTS